MTVHEHGLGLHHELELTIHISGSGASRIGYDAILTVQDGDEAGSICLIEILQTRPTDSRIDMASMNYRTADICSREKDRCKVLAIESEPLE